MNTDAAGQMHAQDEKHSFTLRFTPQTKIHGQFNSKSNIRASFWAAPLPAYLRDTIITSELIPKAGKCDQPLGNIYNSKHLGSTQRAGSFHTPILPRFTCSETLILGWWLDYKFWFSTVDCILSQLSSRGRGTRLSHWKIYNVIFVAISQKKLLDLFNFFLLLPPCLQVSFPEAPIS